MVLLRKLQEQEEQEQEQEDLRQDSDEVVSGEAKSSPLTSDSSCLLGSALQMLIILSSLLTCYMSPHSPPAQLDLKAQASQLNDEGVERRALRRRSLPHPLFLYFLPRTPPLPSLSRSSLAPPLLLPLTFVLAQQRRNHTRHGLYETFLLPSQLTPSRNHRHLVHDVREQEHVPLIHINQNLAPPRPVPSVIPPAGDHLGLART
eukprot:767989-Hanusia_phi.AAC.8